MNDGSLARPVSLTLNDRPVAVVGAGTERLSSVLRDRLGLTGTKVGCEAGDCGICTVLLDGEQACACLLPLAQVEGRSVTTVEGLAELRDGDGLPVGQVLQQCFARHGAAQCGICTPGMLLAAADLLMHEGAPDEVKVQDALGGVLCRCTGYRQIISAVVAAGRILADARARAATATENASAPTDLWRGDEAVRVDAASDDLRPRPGAAVGARLPRLDGREKLDGRASFGDDAPPADALDMLIVRSPLPRARFFLGDLQAFVAAHAGVVGVLTADDIPNNRFAIFPDLRDQPALAESETRLLGEAVLAIVGERAALAGLDPNTIPVEFESLPAADTAHAALAEGAPIVQQRYPDNILCRGHVQRGGAWPDRPLAAIRSGTMSTVYVEHAYLEPEAGHAVWHGAQGEHTVTVTVTTQTPYMDRDEIAHMFALAPERVRIVPTAVGGGFGGKLDLSVQPLVVAGARKFGRPVRLAYSRQASMLASPKRHPAQMRARLGADADGRFVAYEFEGDFTTGAYASWGPTVANRVPIHACGPYRFESVRADTRAVLTHDAVAGAFRGFGVPQSTLLVEALIDELALELGRDPLELRLQNALRAGDLTATGQRLEASVGLVACLEALAPAWRAAGARVEQCNRLAAAGVDGGAAADVPAGHRPSMPGGGGHETLPSNAVAGPGWCTDPHGRAGRSRLRRGRGIACMWYGIGNTVIANPSTMTVALRDTGRVVLYNGAVDIGQGTYTVLPQICADALGLPVSLVDQVHADTALTRDAGKSSASRQTFVSGNAARLAGEALRARLLEALGAAAGAELALANGVLSARDAAGEHRLELAGLPGDAHGDLFSGEGMFNPPTVPLDANGQGVPYATYGFAAQMVELEVDLDLGTVKLLEIHAAHDVGRAINPMLVEGQIHGGIAQGIGLALMEHYVAGRTDNLHDYLVPTAGDVPPIHVHLIEDAEPLGPYGAKGVGEPALVATAPAILNAIRDACGVRMQAVPVTPDRLHAALHAHGGCATPTTR
ncbi:MAG: molybdopterin cofactor-binding domain-containing protein [Burkholderiaceae bacterium]